MSRPKTDTGASDFVAMIDPTAPAAPNGASESAGAPRRTLIVANRLPATVVAKDGAVDVEPSVGGVATGLKSVHQQGGGWWIGWPGEIPRLAPDARKALDAKLAAMRLLPVTLSATEVKRFYEGYANGVLWPLFHYQIERVPLDSRDFSAYRTVNEKYADAIASVIEPGDAVWIHDYQLAMVPAMLRERAPEAHIGFFLHIPFPSSEVFRVLPQREEILHGLLGADLVGFHTFAYLRHFATSTARVLGLEPEFDRVEHDGREVRFGVFPMGIDAKRFAALAAEEDVLQRVEVIRRGAPEKIILGIDRLDYTKGLRRRLLAFGRFLETHAEWRGRVRYVQIAVPSRTKVEAYAGFRREVEEIVGRINGAYSTAEQAPIHYVGRGFDDRELAALYRAADVCLVTPLRDGMNLVAKEFVASRVDDDGVLILSEFAGASAELGEALPVNPYDIDGAAATIGRALTMPRDERAARMRALRRRVALGDVDRWARNFLTSLDAAAVSPRGPARQARMRDAEQLSTLFASAPKLILFLDYDGTLVPFASTPELATPDSGLIRLMYDLVAAAGVELHLISGRSRGDLERWFGTLPVGIHAEHGLWTRPVGAAEWASVSRPDVSWKDRLKPYLEQVTASTPGSLLEEKTAGFAWHWRRADPEYGALQARELRLHLNDLLSNTPVEVFTGEKVVEVRPQVANKGVIVGRVLAETPEPYLAAAIGDDRTDEDLFRALPADGVAVRVGTGPTRAPHRLSDWTEVRRLLDAIVKLRPGPARAASATNMA